MSNGGPVGAAAGTGTSVGLDTLRSTGGVGIGAGVGVGSSPYMSPSTAIALANRATLLVTSGPPVLW